MNKRKKNLAGFEVVRSRISTTEYKLVRDPKIDHTARLHKYQPISLLSVKLYNKKNSLQGKGIFGYMTIIN